MARPAKNAPLDLSAPIELTAGAIERLTCPMGKSQAFLRDSKARGLSVRVTGKGAKSFVFESKLKGDTLRKTIGDVRTWSIEGARQETNRMRVLIDGGNDPREIDRLADEARTRKIELQLIEELTVGQIWEEYIQERRPFWGDLHYRDHIDKTKTGGKASEKRGAKKINSKTKDGPLVPLMRIKIKDLDSPTIEAWALSEGQKRPTSARLAWRLLCVFLTWCMEHPKYSAALSGINPAKTKRCREAFGKPNSKTDALLREQLPNWFDAVLKIENPIVSAYLQCLLLTGARRRELSNLKWADIDWTWNTMTIKDKVEGTRIVPLTPYVAHLLSQLPNRNKWVFSSHLGKNQKLTDPTSQNTKVCLMAGINKVSLNGLRRSFKTLAEWMDMSNGVVAQIMGHKPSATAEKHYTVRPIDMLRERHTTIETCLLAFGNVEWTPIPNATSLRLVK